MSQRTGRIEKQPDTELGRLCFAPAYRLAAWIRSGEVSARSVLQAYLRQIERHNPRLKALVALDDEAAIQQAELADEALRQGCLWGPLHGVPFTVKDHLDAAGLPSTMGGYPPYSRRIADEDASVIARLKAAGAILIGRTNAEFFPYGTFPVTNNPWDPARSAGRSSSGSAAAVAAGLTPFDIGSDADGSILWPAHQCGIFGMRPTQNRVSLAGLTCPWLSQLFRLMTVFGPLARSPADLTLLLAIIAGPDRRDLNVPPVAWQDAPEPAWPELGIAWSAAIPGSRIATEIKAALEKLVKALVDRGARAVSCMPEVDFTRQAALNRELLVDLIRNAVRLPTAQGCEGDQRGSLACYLRLLDERETVMTAWEAFFDDWDVFLCPAAGATAGYHDEIVRLVDGRPVPEDEILLPLRLAAATGHPAVVMPLAQDGRGLPFGLQLIGRRWDDERLLAIAGRLDKLLGGFCQPPLASL